jgi:glucose/arabinose dehydrogenase
LLDLRDVVSRGDEEGLLSVALAPNFETTGHFYAYFTVADGTISRLSRFRARSDRAALSSEFRILDVAQPFRNHNGGAIRFGPDGFLHLSLGDGGSGGDPRGNGQNLATLLGSILRIDVSQATIAEPYRIPAANPFVATPGARGEIFAYGLRNPWRMSFDPLNGRLWAGDVGQDRVEEIDVIEAGGNYGWNRLEGEECFRTEECSRADTTSPVATYTHTGGNCSVTGGVVYRANRIPAIADTYLYADFCSGRLWALDADRPAAASLVLETDLTIASFGQDAEGEVYLLTFEGQIVRIGR